MVSPTSSFKQKIRSENNYSKHQFFVNGLEWSAFTNIENFTKNCPHYLGTQGDVGSWLPLRRFYEKCVPTSEDAGNYSKFHTAILRLYVVYAHTSRTTHKKTLFYTGIWTQKQVCTDELTTTKCISINAEASETTHLYTMGGWSGSIHDGRTPKAPYTPPKTCCSRWQGMAHMSPFWYRLERLC